MSTGVSDTRPTVLVTVTGQDRPGVTSALFTALAGTDADVLDVEQVVVRDHLTLAVLLGEPAAGDVEAALRGVGTAEGVSVTCTPGHGVDGPRRPRRLHVTLLGAPLLPAAVARITAVVAARGANVDRIRRMSRTPVTSIELDVSTTGTAADLLDLRRTLATAAGEHGVDVAVSPAAWPAWAGAWWSWTSTPP